MEDLTVKGVKYPLEEDTTTGRLKEQSGAALVDQDLQRLVMTAIGSRPRREYFGTELPGLMFENLIQGIPANVSLSIKEAVELWDSRVFLRNIVAQQLPATDTGRMEVRLIYTLSGDYVRKFREYTSVVTVGEPDKIF